ncbi:MAG TPA: LamG-like jellyroll fold domain-containing protein [Bryobacteraceae bacterium]|jgi:hypothetical protein
MIRRLILLTAVFALPSMAGYANCGAVTFPGAATSTQTNITLTFSFSDARFKSLNTTTRNGIVVPTDLIVTDDATCQTLTGSYTWDVEAYKSSAGTGIVLVKIPSYATSPRTLYVGFGNPAVTLYQGGAVGSAYDSNTLLVAPYNVDSSGTLANVDFSSSGCNGVATGVTAAAGQIDGAGSFTVLNTSKNLWGGTTCGSDGTGTFNGRLDAYPSFTYSAWINSSTTSGDIYNGGANGLPQFRVNSGKLSLDRLNTSNVAVSTSSITTGVWQHVAVTWDNSAGVYAFFINGADAGHGTGTPQSAWSLANWSFASHTWQSGYRNTSPSMSIDLQKVANVARPGSWIANEYANESSVPAVVLANNSTGIPPAIY